jgi:hypothetical protein
MDLKALLDTDRIENGVWVTYEDTPFEVRVAYYGRPEMQALYKKCSTKKFDPGTMQEREDLDTVKFRDAFSDQVIKEWRGLTLGVLRKLILLKASEQPDDTPITCTKENKTFLLENCFAFDRWVQSVCQSIEVFNQKQKEIERKNSSGSPTP